MACVGRFIVKSNFADSRADELQEALVALVLLLAAATERGTRHDAVTRTTVVCAWLSKQNMAVGTHRDPVKSHWQWADSGTRSGACGGGMDNWFGRPGEAGRVCRVLSVLGSWVGVRRPVHLSLFPTAPRMVLPQDNSTDAGRIARGRTRVPSLR